jgi:alkylation response protein AidB-like acyl-CoA dehydrogenase
MNLEPNEDQRMIAETFARFFDEHSSMARVRATQPSGFDPDLWRQLAQMGALTMRVAQNADGLGLLDAVLVMEQAGRTLASGPIAEAMVATRLLTELGGPASEWLPRIASGEAVVTIALRDAAHAPRQWVAGGAVADAVLFLDGDAVALHMPAKDSAPPEPNLGGTPMREMTLAAQRDRGGRAVAAVAQGPHVRDTFLAGIEEWKLLTASALNGLAREALRLAADYAKERLQFGQPIGAYQGVSHPLAARLIDVDAAKLIVWRAIRAIADRDASAGGQVSLAYWWAARSASETVSRALHTFGGYGLTVDYDIHLFHLRAKAWPLVLGDPADVLCEAGRRLWGGENTALPAVGDISINFDVGDEARALAQETTAFFESHLTPERKARAHYSYSGHDRAVDMELAEARLLYPAWPKEYGGREVSGYAAFAAMQAWDDQDWTGHGQATTNMIGQVMMRFGSDELKRAVLPKLARGEVICSLGFSEPGSGSDVFAAKTKAVRDGDEWVINGQKMFTSGANLAGYVLLLTRTDPEAPKHKGITMFIVPLDAPGVEVQSLQTWQDEPTTITFYSGVRIPDSYRLGEVNGGLKVLVSSLEMEHGGSGFLNAHVKLLRAAVAWAREAPRGSGRAIDDSQVRTRLARVASNVIASDVITRRLLWAQAERKPAPAFGPASKVLASELFLKDGLDMLDLAAPNSLSKRAGPLNFINQCSRHGSATTIYGGTSEVHYSMVAERGLGLPRTRAAD